MKEDAAPPEDTFYCARCQTVFSERPLFCPNCDTAENGVPTRTVWGGACVGYVLILFGPILFGVVAYPALGWVALSGVVAF